MSEEKKFSTDDVESLIQENLPISIIDEDNRKVRTVIEKLERNGWHSAIQRSVKVYCECSEKRWQMCERDKDSGEVRNSKPAWKYLHYDLNELLFIYQDAVNVAIRNEDYSFSLRKKIIIFLGCKCVFCGSEDIDYLQLDHKNSDGGKQRETFKRHSLNVMLYFWNNLIDAYLRLQVLCLKCHRLKSTNRITQEDIEEQIKRTAEAEIKTSQEKPKEEEAKT